MPGFGAAVLSQGGTLLSRGAIAQSEHWNGGELKYTLTPHRGLTHINLWSALAVMHVVAVLVWTTLCLEYRGPHK